MRRTRNRPLPAGRVGLLPAAIFALALAVGGILYLGFTVNRLTALLAAATFLMYDLLYTPLKRVHPVSLLVGAVPGALPIVGGWAAASGRLDPGAWALFGVLFLWQLPHFLSLSWLLSDDYRRAGLAMPRADDRSGRGIRSQTVAFTLALLPVSLLPTVYGLTGSLYTGTALALGLFFMVPAVAFSRAPSAAAAGRVFRYSIVYLPLLLAAAAVDRIIGII
jgi:protoheme IX farnesyltransferase